jgi:phosphoenolpyruvate carboxylase
MYRGFYGVGTAFKNLEDNNEWQKFPIYITSLFKTLIENSMMALSKSFFPLAQLT